MVALQAMEVQKMRGQQMIHVAKARVVDFMALKPNGSVSKPIVPLVNIKIAGKWMFIPVKMVLLGIDPYPSQTLGFLGDFTDFSWDIHGIFMGSNGDMEWNTTTC